MAAGIPFRLRGHDLPGAAAGQPGWLRPWFNFWHNLQHPYVMFFAYLVAAVETLIAVAVIVGFTRKPAYLSAATFRVLTWATAEWVGTLDPRLVAPRSRWVTLLVASMASRQGVSCARPARLW